MKFSPFLLTISLFSFLQSCNQAHVKPAEQAKAIRDTSAFGRLKENFDSLKLPAYFPPTDATHKPKAIDVAMIGRLFHEKSNIPAFAKEDVPGISVNAGNAQYFSEGMFTAKGSAWYAFIIHKKDGGEFYYLCTMNAKGEYINGLCIAYRMENKAGILERDVSLNEDYSIEIRQTDVTGIKDPTARSAFFEINKEGIISAIKNNGI